MPNRSEIRYASTMKTHPKTWPNWKKKIFCAAIHWAGHIDSLDEEAIELLEIVTAGGGGEEGGAEVIAKLVKIAAPVPVAGGEEENV